ncbi:hypothetical protein GCM10020255_069100 [Rhodococcus baikonurensis]
MSVVDGMEQGETGRGFRVGVIVLDGTEDECRHCSALVSVANLVATSARIASDSETSSPTRY